ncbi:MAG TPA: excinuclease ABC subunit UvrC [Ignavibacteriaceae bacterium]|nr:excinuclease ABC subunit UvrC [Ignavibacteriaceae bacterium]
MTENIKSKFENLPDSPGVYQFLNENNKVLYVGKAKNLKNRVRSYFHSSGLSNRIAIMVSKAKDIQLIITENELEALILENNLIKELKPRYNVKLKDDKTYPFIKVTNELFPRIYPTRQITRDGSKYFGPYTDVRSMKASLRMINRIFKIRSCKFYIDSESIEKKKVKICLDYHIKKCDGPCEGLISPKDYNDMVNEVVKLLSGKTIDLLAELKTKMDNAVSKLEFEKAAELRDKISQIQSISEKQNVVSDDFENRDVIAVASEGKEGAATIFNIRSGKLISKKQLKLTVNGSEQIEEIISALIKQYYTEYIEIPNQIVIEKEPEDSEIILDWLINQAGHKIKFIVPKKKSPIQSLLKMCKENATLQLKEIQIQKMKKEGNVPYTLSALQRDLRLKSIPKRIECFDISNLQGTDTVASMVVFEDGKPKKSKYRKFIINSVDGPNDFASMQEVVSRRYTRLINEQQPLPDLIMVDGGKGQLSSAVEILNGLGLKNYTIIGLAKRLEEVFLPNQSEAIIIPKTSSSLKLLQQVRDEAHRFAITFHRLLRSKRTITTSLLEIKGIGEQNAFALITAFGSIKKIKSASVDALTEVIGKTKAQIIFDYYNPDVNE